MEYKEITQTSKQIFNGKVLNLRLDTVLLENGNHATREVVEHSGGVGVLAVDDQDNILFVRQLRYPRQEILLEIPAGKLEKGEDPAACGLRELEEETGYQCKIYQPLCNLYVTPAYCTEMIHVFFARDLVKSTQNLDLDEFLSVVKIPYKKAVQMVIDGDIPDSKTQIAILKYYYLRENHLI